MTPFIPLFVFVIITLFGIKKANIFPKITSVTVLFREKFLTGNSSGLLGTYKNILEVVITDQELWIRTFLPFLGFAAVFNGIHKVPVSTIRKIEIRGSETTVYFLNEKGAYFHFSFQFKKTDKFISVVKQLHPSVKINTIR